MAIGKTPSPDEQYDKILQGLQQGHRVGFNANGNKFEDITDVQHVQKSVVTDLDSISFQIKNFISDNKDKLNPTQIRKLKEALKERADTLENRTKGARGAFMWESTKTKINESAIKLRSLQATIDQAAKTEQKTTQTFQSTISTSQQKVVDGRAGHETKETTRQDVREKSPSDKAPSQREVSTTRAPVSASEETPEISPPPPPPPPPGSTEEGSGGAPPPPPPPGMAPKPQLLKGESAPPSFKPTQFQTKERSAIESEMQQAADYVGINPNGSFNNAQGLSKLIETMSGLQKEHEAQEEFVSAAKGDILKDQVKLDKLQEARKALETLTANSQTTNSTTIKYKGFNFPIYTDTYWDQISDKDKKKLNITSANKLSEAKKAIDSAIYNTNQRIDGNKGIISRAQSAIKTIEQRSKDVLGIDYNLLPATLTKKINQRTVWNQAYNSRKAFLEGRGTASKAPTPKETPVLEETLPPDLQLMSKFQEDAKQSILAPIMAKPLNMFNDI